MSEMSMRDRMRNHYDGIKNTANNSHLFLRETRTYKSEGLATLTVTPERACAAQRLTVTTKIQTGDSPLPVGTRIRVFVVGYNPFIAIHADDDTGNTGGIIRIDTEHASRFEIEVDGKGFTGRSVNLTVTDNALESGEQFDVLWGADDTLVLSEVSLPVIFHLEIDDKLTDRAVLEVNPLEPETVECILPADARPGSSADARLLVRDKYLNLVDTQASIEWNSANGIETPDKAAVERGDEGARLLRDFVRIDTAGTHRLEGTEKRSGIKVVSNPVVCSQPIDTSDSFSNYELCFGDIHCHDYLSPGRGSTLRCYQNARRMGLQFLSLPIQTQGANLTDDRWTISNALAEEFYSPGEFVTIPAFEWQQYAFGHKNVYYMNPDQPYLSPYDERSDTPDKLFAELRKSDALVLAHHISYALDCHVPGTDWNYTDEFLQPGIELCSVHGCCETADGERPLVRNAAGPYFREVLENGHHLGVIGGSDSHNGWPVRGVREPRPYSGGMACVYAKTLTRAGIFEAIRARRCYATTGARIIVQFTLNDFTMGAVCPHIDQRELSVFVAGTAPVSRIEVIKNGVVFDTKNGEQMGNGLDWKFDIVDSASDINREDWYYVKVVQTDGELAFSSPIWVAENGTTL